MKRFLLVALSILVLCSLSLPITLVNASYAGYSTTNYQGTAAVTDGRWTSGTEWTDAATLPSLPATFLVREKWSWPGNIIEHFLIEFYADSTNDTGDYVQICIDCQANGGTAPQSDDIRIDYVGHRQSGLALYRGNGTGWAPFTSYTYGTDFQIAETKSASQMNSSLHWIVEIMMDRSKAEFDISGAVPAYAPWIRFAVYDASSGAGVQAWPPTSRDVPNDWGLETGVIDNMPEGLTIVPIVLLSSVAVAGSFYLLRKRPNPKIIAP